MTKTPEAVIAEAVGSIKLSDWEDAQDRCVRSVTKAVHTALREHGMLVEGDLTAAHCTSVSDTEESEGALPGDLTDETIERAAKAIWATRYPESRPDIAESTWAEVTAPDDWMPEALDVMEEARVALAAARVAPESGDAK